MSGAIPKGSVRPKKDEEVLVGDPLDKKIMTVKSQGVEKKVPALHSGWCEKTTLARYIQPPYDEDGIYPPGAQEMWVELMEYLQQDLKHLLSLPHHRFWSQVVYDPGVHECLESYLMNARRSFDDEVIDDFSARELESIHRLVLLVCIRMATYKESKEDHITPQAFGDIIYENFLFDICKIFDICVLYGHTNPHLITKMIGNIFTNQSKYYDDLSETVPTITLAFENIEKKLGVAENLMPLALSDMNGQLAVEDIHDITLFLTDTLLTLQRFLTCHLPACTYFHDSFQIRLSAFYERVVPAMMDVLSEQGDDPQQQLWIAKLMKRIEIARLSMLTIFRVITQHMCFEPLKTQKASPTVVGECVEKFLHVMSTCNGEKIFITDYCSQYPLSDDLEFFKQHDGDVTSLNFITDAVSTVMSEMGLTSDMKDLNLEESTSKEKSPSDTSGMNGYAETGSTVPSNIELSSMVSHVQDLLPDLGVGFIQQCLQYYGYSTETVINALLEGSLPPSLVTLDRSMPAIEEPTPPPPVIPADTEEKTVRQVDYMDRANIYANDEFDVFSRKDVDRSKVHKGKKSKANTYVNIETDEDDRERMKEIVRQYEERGGTSIYEDEFRYEPDEAHSAWLYEDEYDDTYDGGDPGNIDVKHEPLKRRPGIIGAGRLNTHIDRSSSHSDSSDEDKSELEDKSEGKEENKTEGREENKKSQGGARPKNMGSKRGVQRMFTSTSSNSSRPKQNTPTPEREEAKEKSRENVIPFCENPEDVRQRAEQRRQERDAFRYKGYRGRDHAGPDNGPDNEHYASRPKVSAASNRNSGKGWRQGQSGDDDNRRYHGGKYKEDTNHGKAQTKDHRHKMIHKNEHKRQGAQAKFNKNN